MKMTEAVVVHWNRGKDIDAPWKLELHECDHLRIETDTKGFYIDVQTLTVKGDSESRISVKVYDERTEHAPFLFNAEGPIKLNPKQSMLGFPNPFDLYESKTGWDTRSQELVKHLLSFLEIAKQRFENGGTTMTVEAIKVRTLMEDIMRKDRYRDFGACDTAAHECLVSIINSELGTAIGRWDQ